MLQSVAEGSLRMYKIELFMIPGDANNDFARQEVRKLQDVEVQEIVCAPIARKIHLMPAMVLKSGLRAFGIENIRSVVSAELARAVGR